MLSKLWTTFRWHARTYRLELLSAEVKDERHARVRGVRLCQGMLFLGLVFTEDLDVVLVHLIEFNPVLLSSVLGIHAQYI